MLKRIVGPDVFSVRVNFLLNANLTNSHTALGELLVGEPCQGAAQQHNQQHAEASNTCNQFFLHVITPILNCSKGFVALVIGVARGMQTL
jgi:hypothetical protein